MASASGAGATQTAAASTAKPPIAVADAAGILGPPLAYSMGNRVILALVMVALWLKTKDG